LLPIKKLLPAACPLGVKISTTSFALAGTVTGVSSVAVYTLKLWLGMLNVWEPARLRLASVKAPVSV
jgi:hypothetical protein